MPDLKLPQKELKEEVVKEMLKSSEECSEDALKEFKEKYEESILAAYVDEKNNYIVDGAIIRCDQMSDKYVYIGYEEGKKILHGEGKERAEELDPDVKKEIFEYFFEANTEKEEVRRLSAVHATEQADNGIPFATVSDCTCLREVEDCEKRGRKPASQASIVSLGNCKIMKSSDIREIEKRMDKAREYGTCYCLIQPASEWVNPYCIESLEGNCDGKTETDYVVCEDITSYIIRVTRQVCNDDSHHSTMKWSTKEGQKEGLTLLSTLLCRRGGRITIEVSGQSVVGFSLEESLKVMEQYLQGEVSEERLDGIIPWVAENCGLEVAQMAGGDFEETEETKEKDDYYNNCILAWSYYWNEQINKGFFEGEKKVLIRPDVVKAMIMDESSWGMAKSKNAERDVMQVLFPGDYGLWILSGYDPTEEKRKHKEGEDSKTYKVWIADLDEKDNTIYKEGDIRDKFDYYTNNEKKETTTTNKAGFGDGLGILRDNVITIIDGSEEVPGDSTGEYLIHYDRVTPNMGIACGTAYLAYNMQDKKSEEAGVAAYNGGGAERVSGKLYVNKINEKLSNLQYDDGRKPEPLKE